MSGIEFSKALKAETGMSLLELFVLGRGNDPYSIGTPAHLRDAEWFVQQWERFNCGNGFHIRRVHYRMISHTDIFLPDGTAYENTDECWALLSKASKYARLLGLVDAALFVDRRNPGLSEFASNETVEPCVMVSSDVNWDARSIEASVPTPWMHIPEPEVFGYTTCPGDQACLVEVWIEKSTMNDELLPLCRSLDANLVTSIGFQSITATVNLVKRALEAEKPARVLYIADHDPAGDGMAIAVARQAQYRIEQQLGIDLDLTIEELMLTPEQVRRYNLPRIPIKEKDRRRQAFEDRHGGGAVELDALEALHPGRFAKIVRKAIKRYRDTSLRTRTSQAYREAQDIVSQEWSELTGPFRAELRDVEKEAWEIYKQYQVRLRELSSQMRTDLEPINERLQELSESFNQEADTFDPVIPDKPYGIPDGPPVTDPLFDSSREHLEQLQAFRRHKA